MGWIHIKHIHHHHHFVSFFMWNLQWWKFTNTKRHIWFGSIPFSCYVFVAAWWAYQVFFPLYFAMSLSIIVLMSPQTTKYRAAIILWAKSKSFARCNRKWMNGFLMHTYAKERKDWFFFFGNLLESAIVLPLLWKMKSYSISNYILSILKNVFCQRHVLFWWTCRVISYFYDISKKYGFQWKRTSGKRNEAHKDLPS